MKKIHIVGRRNHGKTTLVTALLEAFCARGYRVGSIKHSSHEHELDTPGKDSHRHRTAGATPAAIVTPPLIGLYLPHPPEQDFYALLAPLYAACDLVLVEGNIDATGPKVEVWRQERATPLLADTHEDIIAVITDDQPPSPVPLWPRSDITTILDLLIQALDLPHKKGP